MEAHTFLFEVRTESLYIQVILQRVTASQCVAFTIIWICSTRISVGLPTQNLLYCTSF